MGMEKEGERDVGMMKVEADSTLKVAGDAEGTRGFQGLNTVILWGWQDSDARCRRALDVSGIQGVSQGRDSPHRSCCLLPCRCLNVYLRFWPR